ncbi:hypothetical protein C7974DRAFT_394719 [Boeremia exigua]|uniref:uncharacterized protein n=1 Tax=Boeremia exigua TaxID=749465 RepID=UPI001E8CD9CA|nr:uncharacterized protein C7974DRAFT_394719 [Boeremia exigua]KAH6629566.1 hypothetical protein C7974DRAFT_394719 [Boeremia exigua]
MHATIFTVVALAAAPLALAQSGMSRMTSAPSATPSASGAVVTMMWDNSPTASATSMGAGMSGMSAGQVMTMSNGQVMTMSKGMSGMSMTTATGTAMAGMSMSGSAGRRELASGAVGAGWVVISLGAGIGFLAGLL